MVVDKDGLDVSGNMREGGQRDREGGRGRDYKGGRYRRRLQLINSGTTGPISSVNLHHCQLFRKPFTLSLAQYNLYYTLSSYSLTSINSFSTISVAVRLTILRVTLTLSSGPSTSMLSSSSAFLRFIASQCKYSKLCLGAGLRAMLSGGAANHRTSFVSGSRSKCLAGRP